MARKAESNGVKETLIRLFGHDDDRSLLAKLAGRDPLKQHRLDPDSGSNVFKRSTECDNLIKNLLALDAVFNSQDMVCELAESQVSSAKLHQEIERARARLEQKLHAYSYWVDRLSSLEKVLREQSSLEDFVLEDRLLADSQVSTVGKGTPYALRAVQLLERVEEQGRSSLLSPDQLNEKAWALYRLGLAEQAVAVARQAVEVDAEHSEAWMLLAICCINDKRAADQEVARYKFQREEAEPLSGHERWAAEMRDMAEDRRAKALADHRAVVFPALLYWPRDLENPYRRYRYRENYEQIRNWCIDWLYSLLLPDSGCLPSDVDRQLAYEANGLAPEFVWQEKLSPYSARWRVRGERAHGLRELEIQVAERICREWEELIGRHEDFAFFQRSLLEPSRRFLKLKLLHIHYVLGLSGYEVLRQRFHEDLRYLRWGDLSAILHQPSLFQTLTTHCAGAGLEELIRRFDSLVEQVAQEQRGDFAFLKSNLLCREYHHGFVRGEFAGCLRVAQEAQAFLASSVGFDSHQLGFRENGQSNILLSLKHWKYMELRAAIEIARESAEAQQALLSVAQPAQYFADEADYLIHEFADIEGVVDEWYEAPYGESILTSGEWMQAVDALLKADIYSDQEMALRARELLAQLAPLVVKKHEVWSLNDYWRTAD